ncbi:penicillin-binding protein 1C [Helicobacter canis]|nr:penicillin-binding protein 1C [Helicobacter canis]
MPKPQNIPTKRLRLWSVVGLCAAFVGLLWVLSDTSRLTFEQESLVSFDRDDELLSFFVNEQDNFKVSINTDKTPLPELVQSLVILYEDKRFYEHYGVDLLALARTIWVNLTRQKRHGASTITMQVAKLGSRDKRTLWNKFTQTLQALRLESSTSKQEILRLYLDNTPYGSNIVGIKSAALLYFHRQLESLTPAQAALLAVLPNTPNLLFTNPQKLLQKRDMLLKRALDSRLISEMDYKLALLEPAPTLERANSIAPHLTRHLAKHLGKRVLRTTLSKPLQLHLESMLKDYAQITQDKGVANLSCLVIEAKSGDVLGYVGSQDFYDLAQLGQVDGVQAKRNVGSTLKPFLYALALDSGLIIPQTKLKDTNQFYGNFNPHNNSRQFYGQASALWALRNSLNAPFVALLQEYGVQEFFYFLRENAPFSDRDYAKYGLSLILGTKELSLYQLATLYLGLRRGGEFIAPNLLEQGTKKPTQAQKSPPKDLTQEYIHTSARAGISQASAYLTLEALLNLPINTRSSVFAHKVAWKSGTSYGNVDSWAIGVSDEFVVAVWGGNFNAKSSTNLTGREIAGVAMFDIFELLGGNNAREFKEWRQVGKWSSTPRFRQVRIDSDGYRTLEKNARLATMPYYAKPLRTKEQLDKDSSIIIYPTQDLRFSRLSHSDDGIVALVRSKELAYFFLNSEFIGTSHIGRLKISPKIGTNTLYVITQGGEHSSVRFEVLE